MKWSLICLGVLSIAGGCRGAGAARDPFLGRTTVQPPGTGQATESPPPYYSPPGSYAPGAGAPAYGPPANNYQFPQGSQSPPSDWRSSSALTSQAPGGQLPPEVVLSRPADQANYYEDASQGVGPANVRLASGEEPLMDESEYGEESEQAYAGADFAPSGVNVIRIVEPGASSPSSRSANRVTGNPSGARQSGWESSSGSRRETVVDIADLPPARSNWR